MGFASYKSEIFPMLPSAHNLKTGSLVTGVKFLFPQIGEFGDRGVFFTYCDTCKQYFSTFTVLVMCYFFHNNLT